MVSRLMNRRTINANLTKTKKLQKKDCNSELIVHHMRLYITLEDVVSTDIEKQIVCRSYMPLAFARLATSWLRARMLRLAPSAPSHLSTCLLLRLLRR